MNEVWDIHTDWPVTAVVTNGTEEYQFEIDGQSCRACHRNIHRELISPRSRLEQLLSKRAYFVSKGA